MTQIGIFHQSCIGGFIHHYLFQNQNILPDGEELNTKISDRGRNQGLTKCRKPRDIYNCCNYCCPGEKFFLPFNFFFNASHQMKAIEFTVAANQ